MAFIMIYKFIRLCCLNRNRIRKKCMYNLETKDLLKSFSVMT